MSIFNFFFRILDISIMTLCTTKAEKEAKTKLPHILFAIADDQSYPYASVYGTQGDPRMSGSEIFDSYPRYSSMRNFEGFNKRGTYNPKF